MNRNVTNTQTFERICTERKVTRVTLLKAIDEYAERQVTEMPASNPTGKHLVSQIKNGFTLIANYRKQLSRKEMSDEDLRLGLRIIGLTEEEIQKVK